MKIKDEINATVINKMLTLTRHMHWLHLFIESMKFSLLSYSTPK